MRSMSVTAPARVLLDRERSDAAAARPARTAVDHLDSSPGIGRDAYRLCVDDNKAGKGSIVVALVWLAFYVVAAVHSLIAAPAPPPSTAQPPALAAPSPR
jgi:hypothetical protein